MLDASLVKGLLNRLFVMLFGWFWPEVRAPAGKVNPAFI